MESLTKAELTEEMKDFLAANMDFDLMTPDLVQAWSGFIGEDD